MSEIVHLAEFRKRKMINELIDYYSANDDETKGGSAVQSGLRNQFSMMSDKEIAQRHREMLERKKRGDM